MNTVRYLSGTLAACALAAGLYAWQRPHDDGSEAAITQPPAPSRAAVPPGPPAPMQVQAQAAPAANEPPLNVQVERLLATRKPEDAYRAYWLVANCAAFNLNQDRIIFDEEEVKHPALDALPGFRAMTEEEKRHDARLCNGMTERERQSRLDYLAISAKAGVAGAAFNFAIEGPFGDPSALETRPADPLVQAWKATAIAQLTQAAEAGADVSAIQYLRAAYGSGAMLTELNPLLAYRYALAMSLIDEDMAGPGKPLAGSFASQREHASATVQDFSPEQRAVEAAAARRIADVAKAQREQARKLAPGG